MKPARPRGEAGPQPGTLPRPAGSGSTPELGWTAVACSDGSCCPSLGAQLRTRLGAVVRTSPYAMLVTAGCPFAAAAACPVASPGAFGGAVTVVLQRCTAQERRPVGSAVLVGPVRTEADVETVCRWIALGEFDPRALPQRLRHSAGIAQSPLN